MDLHRSIGFRPIGVAAAAALAVGMATTGSAAATPYAGSVSVASDTLTDEMGTQHADQIALRLAAGDPTTLQVDFGEYACTPQSAASVATPSSPMSFSSGAGSRRVLASTRTTPSFADAAALPLGGPASGDADRRGGDGNELVPGGSGDERLRWKSRGTLLRLFGSVRTASPGTQATAAPLSTWPVRGAPILLLCYGSNDPASDASCSARGRSIGASCANRGTLHGSDRCRGARPRGPARRRDRSPSTR